MPLDQLSPFLGSFGVRFFFSEGFPAPKFFPWLRFSLHQLACMVETSGHVDVRLMLSFRKQSKRS